MELQQEHQEQEGHSEGWGYPSAGTPAQVSTSENAYSSGWHPTGMCFRGERGLGLTTSRQIKTSIQSVKTNTANHFY